VGDGEVLIDWTGVTDGTWDMFISLDGLTNWYWDQTLAIGVSPVGSVTGFYTQVCNGGENPPPSGTVSNMVLAP
jgi:hypothetical protein